MWAAGDFNETTRDVIQKKMLGSVEWHGDKKGVDGSGMIPRELILQDTITWKAGVPDLVDTVRIKHRLGGESVLGLKSYQQGRRSFQGTEQDIIWTDEEPPIDVYNEMLIRLMTTEGHGDADLHAAEGWTEVVESFYPEKRALRLGMNTGGQGWDASYLQDRFQSSPGAACPHGKAASAGFPPPTSSATAGPPASPAAPHGSATPSPTRRSRLEVPAHLDRQHAAADEPVGIHDRQLG
jgi:phage terminase large subunit-like protein